MDPLEKTLFWRIFCILIMSGSGFMVARSFRVLSLPGGEFHLKIAGVGFFLMAFLFFLFLFIRAGSSPDSWFARQRTHDLVCTLGSVIFVLVGLVFLFAEGLSGKILGTVSIVFFGRTARDYYRKARLS